MPKNDDDIRIHVSSSLKNDLFRLADLDGRTLSDYLRYVLELHVYGHRKKILAQRQVPNRESEGIAGNVRELRK